MCLNSFAEAFLKEISLSKFFHGLQASPPEGHHFYAVVTCMCAPAGIPLFSTLFHVLEDVGGRAEALESGWATYWPEDRAAVEPLSTVY